MLDGPGTLTELLDSLRTSEHAVTFADSGTTLPHRELPRLARRIAARLRALGAGPGDLVGVLAPTGPALLTGWFGVIAANAAVTVLPLPPVAPTAAVPHLASILRAGDVRYLLTAGIGTTLAASLAEQIPDLRFLDLDTPAGDDDPSDLEPVPADPDALAVVQFSSGSTARPKGVMLTHDQFLHGVRVLVEHEAGRGDDVLVQWLPLYHDMGLVSFLTSLLTPFDAHLFTARTFVTDTAEILRYTARVGGSIVCGPNFSYDRFLRAATEAFPEHTDPAPLSRWRLALNGAEPVRAHTVREFARVFGPLGVPSATMAPCYGMAEATLAVAIPRPGIPPRILTVDRDSLIPGGPVRHVEPQAPRARELVGVGVPVPGMSVRITDADGDRLPDGHVGEIRIRGRAVTSGYLGDATVGDAAFVDGWLRTGDLGLFDGGELVVVGRIKEMIVVAGRNYYPDDVEEAVRGLPGIHKGHCVAVADSDTERMIVVAESLARPGTPDADALITAIRRTVSGALALAEVEILVVPPRSLPRTTSGKWQRALIAELAREELGDRTPDAVTRIMSEEMARRFCCRVQDIDLAAPVRELPGASSIAILDTIVACERRWRIRLDENALAHVHTAGDLRDLFARTLGAVPTTSAGSA